MKLLNHAITLMAILCCYQPTGFSSAAAEEAGHLQPGEEELTWLRLALAPLPEREPVQVLLAHNGQHIQRVMVNGRGCRGY